jgi:two-component system NtrC family sensor kinase
MMKKKSPKRKLIAKTTPGSKLQKKIAALQRQVLVLENLRKKRLQKPARDSGEVKLLAMGISHEFNNILGAVDGHAEWALESKNPADWKSSLEIIRIACVRSSEITAALRGWGQPQEEQKSLFSVSEVLTEISAIMSPSLKIAEVQLELSSDSSMIYGNKTEILEVILNLIKNSLDAFSNFSASRKKWISISSLKGKSRLQIDVIDNGPGIPEVYQGKVFEPFFTLKGVLSILNDDSQKQLNAPVIAKGSGSGLGLFLSRSIIEEHGGSLSLQASDIGTHFRINLPLTQS